jgi:hypothetical protein
MDTRERRRRGLPDHRQEFIAIRERWAILTNEALREANVDARIDHRSLAAQGIDREPQPAIPLMHLKMEQRGLHSGVAERLRAEYRERVQRRLERAAARDGDAIVPDERRVAGHSFTGAATPGVEEIRRNARDAWVQLRAKERQKSSAQSLDQRTERETREHDTAASESPQDDFAL